MCSWKDTGIGLRLRGCVAPERVRYRQVPGWDAPEQVRDHRIPGRCTPETARLTGHWLMSSGELCSGEDTMAGVIHGGGAQEDLRYCKGHNDLLKLYYCYYYLMGRAAALVGASSLPLSYDYLMGGAAALLCSSLEGAPPRRGPHLGQHTFQATDLEHGSRRGC